MVSWIAASLSILGILFNAKKNIWCWPIWLLSNFLWLIVTIQTQNWPQVILWSTFLVTNIYGWYEWKGR